MAIVSDTSIKLDAHSPKKDAVVDTPGTAAGVNDVRIWAAGSVSVANPQQIVGDFHKLFRYALSQLKEAAPSAGPTIFHMDLGGGDPDIAMDDTPGADQLRLEIGATLVDKQQSHFIDRTFKRLIERWLEEGKA